MLRKGARGAVTGGGNGRREGASAGPLLSGERRRYGRGRVEPLPERSAAGMRGRAPDHYSRGSGGVKGWASRGVAGGGVTTGADRRRDERCCDRRGERRSHGQGHDQALPAGRTPALPEGGAQALPEGASTVVSAGGDGKRDRRGRPLVWSEATNTTTTTTTAATATTAVIAALAANATCNFHAKGAVTADAEPRPPPPPPPPSDSPITFTTTTAAGTVAAAIATPDVDPADAGRRIKDLARRRDLALQTSQSAEAGAIAGGGGR